MEKQDEYFHAVGNMHMHTHYSDGEKWHAEIADDAIAAGLDFIIVTDHNVWVQGVEGYYEKKTAVSFCSPGKRFITCDASLRPVTCLCMVQKQSWPPVPPIRSSSLTP
jgi:hypothetical protein